MNKTAVQELARLRDILTILCLRSYKILNGLLFGCSGGQQMQIDL